MGAARSVPLATDGKDGSAREEFKASVCCLIDSTFTFSSRGRTVRTRRLFYYYCSWSEVTVVVSSRMGCYGWAMPCYARLSRGAVRYGPADLLNKGWANAATHQDVDQGRVEQSKATYSSFAGYD